MNELKELEIAVEKLNDYKEYLDQKEKYRLQNVKRMLANIVEDGFIGGESGVSQAGIQLSLDWANKTLRAI